MEQVILYSGNNSLSIKSCKNNFFVYEGKIFVAGIYLGWGGIALVIVIAITSITTVCVATYLLLLFDQKLVAGVGNTIETIGIWIGMFLSLSVR